MCSDARSSVTGQPPDPVERLAALPFDGAHLYALLCAKLDDARRCEQVWVMDLNWYKRMRRLASVQPEGEEDEGTWVPDIEDRMFRKRIVVRDGGGEPHIEWMTPDEAKTAVTWFKITPEVVSMEQPHAPVGDGCGPDQALVSPGGQTTEASLLEFAWGLIANAGWNAGSGDVNEAKSPGWHEAAIRWRDEYHQWLRSKRTGSAALAALLESAVDALLPVAKKLLAALQPGCLVCAAEAKRAQRAHGRLATAAEDADEPEPPHPVATVNPSFASGIRGPVCWEHYNPADDGPFDMHSMMGDPVD